MISTNATISAHGLNSGKIQKFMVQENDRTSTTSFGRFILRPERTHLMTLQEKIRNLSVSSGVDDQNIYSASAAFLAGYIIKKLDDKFEGK